MKRHWDLGASLEATDEESMGGEIELHILDKSGILRKKNLKF